VGWWCSSNDVRAGAADTDYLKVGGHFGPHNIYENRPDQFVSEDLIFATYQNAGVRVYDIRNKFRPVKVARACHIRRRSCSIRDRTGRRCSAQLTSRWRNGILYCTDFSAGLYIVEYTR
jgi:hypothetical protein